MGRPWKGHAAWSVVDEAEAALGERLAHLLLDAPADVLARTREAQLAVLLTSLVAWEAVRPSVTAPIAFAGHSLGQITALVAAGALPLAAAIRFAARRAELTQGAADRRPGRMAALLGATVEQAEDACSAASDGCWVANDNAPGQVVIAGRADSLEAASARAKEIGVRRVTALNVDGAFHTPLMHEAAVALAGELTTLDLAPTDAPVVSNHDAVPYRDGDGWRRRLADHVEISVRWRASQETLRALGATGFLEVGHGSMLATLAKRTVPDVAVRGVGAPADLPIRSEVL